MDTAKSFPNIRGTETIIAAAGSLFLHALPLVIVLMSTVGQFGLARHASDSASLETIVTITVDAVRVETSEGPPAASVDQAAVVATPPAMAAADPTLEPVPAAATPVAVKPLAPTISEEEIGAPKEIVAVPAEAQPVDLERHNRANAPLLEKPNEAEVSEPDKRTPPPAPLVAARPASTASAGEVAGADSAGKVTATKGELIAYAALVRSQLARRKPAGNGRKGTVSIAFAIDRTGRIGQASIHTSSGNAALDTVALAAVAAAGPLPTPPDGRDLAFVLPFHFR